MQRAQLSDTERLHRVASTENGIAVRVAAPEDLVVQLEDKVVGSVVDHRDLFEDHLSLQRQITFAKRWIENDVADDVGRLEEMLVEHSALIHGVLARCVRVERTAERL